MRRDGLNNWQNMLIICTTHFIVGSSWMKEIYKTAFEAKNDKIFNIGCPRTDIFFNKLLIKKEEMNSFRTILNYLIKK